MAKQESIEAKFDKLFNQVEKLNGIVSDLRKENLQLKEENKALRKENRQLKKRLARYETPKNSGNSSMPPSSDIVKPRRTSSLRKNSGKKPGGQKGHPGKTLEMIDNPHYIEKIVPTSCKNCGSNLSEFSAQYKGRRQVIDLPEIAAKYTEYQIFDKQCSCGCCNHSEYPAHVQSPVSYGPNIQSLVAYLSARQYMPVKRMNEFLSEVLGTAISTGGIDYIINKMAGKATDKYNQIKENVLESSIIGADETGAKVNKKNYWFWAFQNELYTFIGVHPNRGYQAILDIVGNRFEKATLVTDCWASYFKTNAKGHQLCMAHILRELTWFTQHYKEQTWSTKLADLICKAIAIWKEGVEQVKLKAKEIKSKFKELLQCEQDPEHDKLISFHNRMIKYEDWVFQFLDNPDVPPDNNGSERAVRNIKVKQKVSCFFKSEKGAKNYAIIRTVVDTAIKQGISPVTALYNIAAGVTE